MTSLKYVLSMVYVSAPQRLYSTTNRKNNKQFHNKKAKKKKSIGYVFMNKYCI